MSTRYFIYSALLYLGSLRILYNLASFCAAEHVTSTTQSTLHAILWDLLLLGVFGCAHFFVWPITKKLNSIFGISLQKAYEQSLSFSIQLLDILILDDSFSLWRPCPDIILWTLPHSLDGILSRIRRVGWTVMFAQSVLVGHFEVFGIQGPMNPDEKKDLKRGKHPFILSGILVLWPVRVMTLDKFVFASFVSMGLVIHTLVRLKKDEENDIYTKVKSKMEEMIFE